MAKEKVEEDTITLKFRCRLCRDTWTEDRPTKNFNTTTMAIMLLGNMSDGMIEHCPECGKSNTIHDLVQVAPDQELEQE